MEIKTNQEKNVTFDVNHKTMMPNTSTKGTKRTKKLFFLFYLMNHSKILFILYFNIYNTKYT